jgi:hypothetical protein
MAKQSKLICAIILISFLLFRCANQLSPGGGEIDKTPPQIIEISPKNGAINYRENYFEITFSEWVEKRSVQDAIFISPPLEKGLEYDWSGKTLTAYFKDTLKTNTTYSITIGASVEDSNNKNKMAEPVTFAFSTGAQIDSGKISGQIYDNEPSGVMVFAYLNNGKEINPAKQKPDFTSQVGKNGKYSILGLAKGNYNVYAIRDKFSDFIYNKNDDEYGVLYSDINLADTVNEVKNSDFFLSIEDTIAPGIPNVYMRDKNHFLIEFSEPIDTTKILASNFYLYDSTASKKISGKYFYKGDAKGNQFYLAITDTLIPGNQNYFHGEGIFDKASNKLDAISSPITVKNDPDTSAPKITTIGGELPEGKVDYDIPIITIKFDDGFDQSILQKSIRITNDKKDTLAFDILSRDDSWFDIRLKNAVKPKSECTMLLDLNNIVDAAGNKTDSLYKYKISIVNDLDFSGVSGTVANVDDSKRAYVILESADKEKRIYKERVDKKSNFNIPKVLPGKYVLWSFKDKNGNSIYDYGKVMPHIYSEEFIYYPDTLNLRARWPVGDVNLKFHK